MRSAPMVVDRRKVRTINGKLAVAELNQCQAETRRWQDERGRWNLACGRRLRGRMGGAVVYSGELRPMGMTYEVPLCGHRWRWRITDVGVVATVSRRNAQWLDYQVAADVEHVETECTAAECGEGGRAVSGLQRAAARAKMLKDWKPAAAAHELPSAA